MANPWLERRVLAYAHQAGEKEAPSSTLWAIERALALGVTGIELDVHATADGELVVGHDLTLDRTTNGSGAIATTTLAEIRRLDNAYWFVPGEATVRDRPAEQYAFRGMAPADRRFGVATLDEVLEMTAGILVNLDIKQTAPAVAPYEEALARTLAAHDRRDDVIVASFVDEAIERFSAHAPHIPTSLGQNALVRFTLAVARHKAPDPSLARHAAIQAPARFRGVKVVTARFVEKAHALGLAVHVWTVDEPGEMERLCDLGVDGIMSDRPSVLVGVLARLGVAWRP
ncbi:MAG: glycerophosphodiester phosphodiesterase [Acidimicrobiales bacterium]